MNVDRDTSTSLLLFGRRNQRPPSDLLFIYLVAGSWQVVASTVDVGMSPVCHGIVLL